MTDQLPPSTPVPTPVDPTPLPPKDASWAAVTSLICGIVSIIPGFCCGCVGFPAAIAGIIFGVIGLKSQKASFAKIGMGLSIAGILLSILLIILNLIFHLAVPGTRSSF